jgi:hypothetical protein
MRRSRRCEFTFVWSLWLICLVIVTAPACLTHPAAHDHDVTHPPCALTRVVRSLRGMINRSFSPMGARSHSLSSPSLRDSPLLRSARTCPRVWAS